MTRRDRKKLAFTAYFILSHAVILITVLLHPDWPYLMPVIIGNGLLIAWVYSWLKEAA